MSTVTASGWELDHWLKQISQGDRDALAQLYHATGSAVFAYTLSITQNRYDAQDATQDTYISVWQSAADYRSAGKPLAWILTIARNHCRMLQRRQRRCTPLPESAALPAADLEERMLLRLCMDHLSEEDRQILVLHAVAGLTHRQIGQMLELKTSTVLSKYHRAIAKLRQML